MQVRSEIRFAPVGGRRMAFEIRGSGPVLVAPAWWVSHLELDWSDPEFRQFWTDLSAGYTLVRYDRLGVGLSDREITHTDLTLAREVDALRILLDELGIDRVSLIGGSSGSCTSIAFAAAYPERVANLVLYGSYADGSQLTPPGVGEAIIGTLRAHWGLGSRLLSDIFLGDADADQHRRFAELQRAAASAESAAAVLALVYRLDVRADLPLVTSPTLVIHRRDDRAVPYRLGREVAAAIPNATFVPLLGTAHFPWHGDSGAVVRACRDLLAPEQRAPTVVGEVREPTLSAREQQILECVARGLSDREIADHLVVSPHTVHRHVANIRRKLGQTSRTAAVAEAARRGML